MEFFPKSAQAGVFDDHYNQKDEEEPISQKVVIISDDDSDDLKIGGDGRQRRRSVRRLRWTLREDCKLIEVVATRKKKILWKTIATKFHPRTSNSCRLRWLKLFTPEDAFTENRWSEIARFVGDRVMNQWRVMIAHNLANFYSEIYDNHPLKRLCVGPVITNPAHVGDDHNNGAGDGERSMVCRCPVVDLRLSLAIPGHNENSSTTVAAAAMQMPPLYDNLEA